ncbi:hypothetical protein B0E41_19530 [Hydrogenophaga sp. A37]|nr:hypothetical protein B0E41_19530 [Hydrogenophaga sp. A37]
MCRCGQPIFFRNSICLACGAPLGYDPERGVLIPLADQPEPEADQPESEADNEVWQSAEPTQPERRYARCSNLNTAAGCNWLTPLGNALTPTHTLCLCCRLTRRIPDLGVDDHAGWWCRIETAKRRLVSSLLGMRLPVVPLDDDPEQGLAFDILTSSDETPIVTGHEDGVITLDAQEADDPTRELRRTQLLEPYRTLLGHLRHETGHYYWRRLVEHSDWLELFRSEFGDEREDYRAALQKHYSEGPPPDWRLNHVSAYASSHPWEDWAETWAHYLHMTDTLDTAQSFGLQGERLELVYEPFEASVLGQSGVHSATFLRLLNQWMQLAGVLNELSRSMGMPDFYPFVLSPPAVRKLHLVHRIIGAVDARWNPDLGTWSEPLDDPS